MKAAVKTVWATAWAVLASGAWATAAASGEVHVRTIAAAGDGFQLHQRGYNKYHFWPYAGIGDTDAGGTTSVGDCLPAYSTSCSLTLGGTQDASPYLTASTSEASLTQISNGNPYKFGGGSARADLATGELGVLAWGTPWGCPSQWCPGYGTAQAELQDTLTFSIAGANASTITNIGVTFAIDGTITGDASTSAGALLRFGTGSFSTTINGSGEPYTPAFETHNAASGWVSYTISPDNVGRITFSGIYALTGASAQIGLFEQLTAASGGGRADYSHTARISLQLPSSVSFTSNSGVFLTASPVPEPSHQALVLAGLLVVGIYATRRH